MDPKSEWDQGLYDPGAYKLDDLLSMKPIFASIEFHFINKQHKGRGRSGRKEKKGKDHDKESRVGSLSFHL